MRPAPIPEDKVIPGTHRMVISGPDGDLTGPIVPIEACVSRLVGTGSLVYHVRCVPEDGDLEKLARGGAVWITFLEHVVPFDVQVEER